MCIIAYGTGGHAVTEVPPCSVMIVRVIIAPHTTAGIKFRNTVLSMEFNISFPYLFLRSSNIRNIDPKLGAAQLMVYFTLAH